MTKNCYLIKMITIRFDSHEYKQDFFVAQGINQLRSVLSGFRTLLDDYINADNLNTILKFKSKHYAMYIYSNNTDLPYHRMVSIAFVGKREVVPTEFAQTFADDIHNKIIRMIENE